MVCASFCSVVHRVRALVPSSVGLETVSEIWSQCGLFGVRMLELELVSW